MLGLFIYYHLKKGTPNNNCKNCKIDEIKNKTLLCYVIYFFIFFFIKAYIRNFGITFSILSKYNYVKDITLKRKYFNPFLDPTLKLNYSKKDA